METEDHLTYIFVVVGGGGVPFDLVEVSSVTDTNQCSGRHSGELCSQDHQG